MIPSTWLITGGSRGFGRALSLQALATGANVMATGRDLAALSDVSAETSYLPVAHDASDSAQSPCMVQRVIDTFGALDVLVLNAGQGLVTSLEETTTEAERACFDLLYHGPISMIRAALPHMRDKGTGRIIVIGAAASHGNYAGFSAYGAAKAALECSCEALQAEVQPFGIHVSIIVPGPFRTGFIEHAPQSTTGLYAGTVGRFGSVLNKMNGRQPGDPARAAALIVEHVAKGTLPFRLPIGGYAVKKLRDRGQRLTRDADTWEIEAKTADYPV
jgi:NAD(P)-dependent dehydrogenase (short-subunit alcohol dehydrogenase family)